MKDFCKPGSSEPGPSMTESSAQDSSRPGSPEPGVEL